VVRVKGPFFGGAIEKLLVNLRQDRNTTAKYGTADLTMVKSYEYTERKWTTSLFYFDQFSSKTYS
jgi:hypothetical protein